MKCDRTHAMVGTGVLRCDFVRAITLDNTTNATNERPSLQKKDFPRTDDTRGRPATTITDNRLAD